MLPNCPQHFQVSASILCCALWFVAACIFAGVFGWAYARPPVIDTRGIEIELLPNTSSDNAMGFFQNGNECVIKEKIPDECRAYMRNVPACTGDQQLARSASSTKLSWTIKNYNLLTNTTRGGINGGDGGGSALVHVGRCRVNPNDARGRIPDCTDNLWRINQLVPFSSGPEGFSYCCLPPRNDDEHNNYNDLRRQIYDCSFADFSMVRTNGTISCSAVDVTTIITQTDVTSYRELHCEFQPPPPRPPRRAS